MTQNLQTTALEQTTKNLAGEMRLFKQRNKIVGDRICKRCLKACLIKKAEELGVSEHTSKLINQITKEEAGHMGYYLDRGVLIKI